MLRPASINDLLSKPTELQLRVPILYCTVEHNFVSSLGIRRSNNTLNDHVMYQANVIAWCCNIPATGTKNLLNMLIASGCMTPDV
jgi:hypothetical protein